MDGDTTGPGAQTERVRIRRLGKFGKVDPNGGRVPMPGPRTVPEDPKEAAIYLQTLQAETKRRRALTALVLFAVGGLLVSVGVAFTFGWPWGITTLGALTLVVGFLIANE